MKQIQRHLKTFFMAAIALAILLTCNQPVLAAQEKTGNIVYDNVMYYKTNTSIEDSYQMGGTLYKNGLRCRVASDHTTTMGFNFGAHYSSMVFTVGHIDNQAAGSSSIKLNLYKEGTMYDSIDLNNNDLPKQVNVDLNGVHQFEMKWSCRFYDSYFGIAEINLVSDGIVKGVYLNKDSIALGQNNTTAKLEATIAPQDATNQNLTWASSDPNVATVDQTGLVTGIAGGTADITVTTQDGNYVATCPVTVDLPIPLSRATVKLSENSFVYTGSEICPGVTLTYNDKALNGKNDYTTTFSNNRNAGTGTVTITGKGNYSGTLTQNFTITKADPTLTVPQSSFKKTYGDGKFDISATSNVALKYSSNNTSVAKVNSSGKVTLTGYGIATINVETSDSNYVTKSKNIKVTVKPKKAVISKASSPAKSKLKVTWKKDAKATGYEVQVSTNSKFKSGLKKTTVKKASTTSTTFTKLNRGKKYYVRIRSYKKSGSSTIYGSWSKVVNKKVK